MVLSHVSKAIIYVHDYIHNLLDEICPDQTVRIHLWEVLLHDELRRRYCAVMDHSKFLLDIKRSGLPIALNRDFNGTVQKKRQERLFKGLQKSAKTMKKADYTGNSTRYSGERSEYVPLDAIRKITTYMDNSEHIYDDLLDVVESYYKVARERFVDTLCQHVVYHMLLTGPDSPLKILLPDRILQLSPDQLSAIASEGAVTLNQRQVLVRQLESFELAMKVLRS